MTTIHDVAELAKVSIKTVSRVVNNEPRVRDTTRERVLQAIDKLKYRPHQGARLMRSNKSGLIGLISTALSTIPGKVAHNGLSSIHIVKGIQQECRAAGKTLLILDTDPKSDKVDSLVEILESYRVEGIIHVIDYNRKLATDTSVRVPLWLVNASSDDDAPAVAPDDRRSQYLATEYLIAKGHTKLAYVGFPDEIEAGRQRNQGFLQAVDAYGLDRNSVTVVPGLIVVDCEQISTLEAEIEKLLQQEERPTAICFGNDLMAVQGCRALQGHGIRVPEDISVMGFDDDLVQVSASNPPLTTFTLPYHEMGRLAAKRLISQLDKTAKPEVYPLELHGEVIERESVINLK